MKARLTVSMVGPEVNLIPGDEVDGDFAIRLVEAGFAIPVVEERTVEKAVRSKSSKETR